MAPTSAGNRDGLRRYFGEKAEEAKRLKLYKHGRKSRGLHREETETLIQYRAEGATNAELADIFGYQSASSICLIAKQERERNEILDALGNVQRSASAPRTATQTRKQLQSHKVGYLHVSLSLFTRVFDCNPTVPWLARACTSAKRQFFRVQGRRARQGRLRCDWCPHQGLCCARWVVRWGPSNQVQDAFT
jgi:hypothetical protein